jgi:acyl carrier protein
MVTENEIIEFIQKRLGRRINPSVRFFDNAGIDGLDAETLMLEFAREYNVEMSAFEPDSYFMHEGRLVNVWRNAWDALFHRNRLPHKTFKVAHLVRVANERKWFDPV